MVLYTVFFAVCSISFYSGPEKEYKIVLKKMTGNEKVAVAVSAVLLVLFIGAAVLAAVLFRELASTESDFSEYRSRTEIELSELEKKKNAAGVSLTELQSQLALAEKTKDELEFRIRETEEELEKLRTSFSDTDQLYRQLTQQLEELQGTLLEKQTEIDGLRADVRELEKIYSVNLNRQIEIVKELEVLLTDGAPMNAVETPVLDEEGVPMIGEDGEPVVEIHYEYPRIAVYYEDLGRGYRYEWNGDISFNSASCVKAPFALAILKEASAERAEYDRQLAEYIAVNGPVEVLPDYTPKFDFDQIFTYTEKDYKAGSGVIKDADFGTEYTYLELIRLMLKNSDNVAFAKLRDVYGVSSTKSLAKSLGTKAMKSNMYNASAADLGKVMRAIYEFTESDAAYASFMKETMRSSIHTVMIGYGVSPKKIAHKYGWDTDAYHDMAIVYDAHPYVLVFMSDMDSGGSEVNTFVQKVVGLIDDLHENFYK